MKIVLFWFEFHWSSIPKGPTDYVSSDSGNGLVPHKQQTITWINVDQYVWCQQASEGHNELIPLHW